MKNIFKNFGFSFDFEEKKRNRRNKHAFMMLVQNDSSLRKTLFVNPSTDLMYKFEADMELEDAICTNFVTDTPSIVEDIDGIKRVTLPAGEYIYSQRRKLNYSIPNINFDTEEIICDKYTRDGIRKDPEWLNTILTVD